MPSPEDREEPSATSRSAANERLAWAILGLGALLALIALVSHAGDARSAAAQDWPPFVLVAGLLLIGLVAQEDGLFAAAGQRLARAASNGVALFLGAALLITIVTATLNLDTSVAFLTPVLVYTARSRREPEAPLLIACLLLSNAGSLFLPGSNLTNLIVLGHLGIGGAEFLSRMWLAAAAAAVVTTAVLAVFHRHHLRASADFIASTERPVIGLGLAAVIGATVLVLALHAPAIPVAVIGVAAVSIRLARRRGSARRAVNVLGLPVLCGLFGVAVALGTLGRAWSGPATLLGHLDPFGTAAIGAVGSVIVNNLPAASLLAARPPVHPYSLLVGLNLGPNLFVTGSLAWFLWRRAARGAGAQPSIRETSRIGLVAVPLSMVAAVAILVSMGVK